MRNLHCEYHIFRKKSSSLHVTISSQKFNACDDIVTELSSMHVTISSQKFNACDDIVTELSSMHVTISSQN